MALLKAILDCLTGDDDQPQVQALQEKRGIEPEEQLANDVLETLFTAEKPDHDFKARLQTIVHTEGWYESLAKRILNHLVAALKSGRAMGVAMKDAFNKASDTANDFVHKHPVFAAAIVTVVAIGILVLLMPWVVEVLGFGELGPVGGSFAAWWQSTFPEAEAESFFAYLQRLGMKWGRK